MDTAPYEVAGHRLKALAIAFALLAVFQTAMIGANAEAVRAMLVG